MAQKAQKTQKSDTRGAGPRKRPGFGAGQMKRKNCYFCREKVAEVDYKNVNQLRRYISEKGKIRKRDEQRARHEARSFDEGQQIAETLGKTVLRFEVKAGPTGVLFGSVTPTDIADEIWRTRKVRVDRRKIGVDNLKRIGRYDVPIEVFQDVSVEVKTLVVPEGGELPSEEELAAMEAAERAEEQPATAEPEAPAGAELAEEMLAEPSAEPEPEPLPDEEPF